MGVFPKTDGQFYSVPEVNEIIEKLEQIDIDVDEDLSKIKEDISEMKEDLSEMEEDITTLTGEVSDLNDEYAAARPEWAIVAGDTVTSTFFGYGYTTATNGNIYAFLPFSRKVMANRVTISSLSSVYIRGVNGIILDNISSLASLNLTDIIVSENGFRLLLTGLTTNWLANTPISIVGTFTFTFDNV